MNSSGKILELIDKHPKWTKELETLRAITLKTNLSESIKWGTPTYTFEGKNIVSIGAFKNYVGLWFFNGSFLSDTHKKIFNSKESKAKSMRQWRFYTVDEMDELIILEYLNEAIINQKEGKVAKIVKNTKPVVIPVELQTVLNENKKLNSFFKSFSSSKQREFANHISSAKREATKITRIEKIIPLILSGKGLHDKYKNCSL